MLQWRGLACVNRKSPLGKCELPALAGAGAWPSPRAKRNGLSVRGHTEAVPGQAAPRRMAHPTVPIVLFGRWFQYFQRGAWPVSIVSGSWDCGRIAGLNLGAVGAYSTDVRAATNFHGAQKPRNWLGDRYSMARRRNEHSKGWQGNANSDPPQAS